MTKLVYKYQEKSKSKSPSLVLLSYEKCLSDLCTVEVIGMGGVLTLAGRRERLVGGKAEFPISALPDGDLALTLTCGTRVARAHGLYKSSGAVYPKIVGIDGIGALEYRITEIERELNDLKLRLSDNGGQAPSGSLFSIGETK